MAFLTLELIVLLPCSFCYLEVIYPLCRQSWISVQLPCLQKSKARLHNGFVRWQMSMLVIDYVIPAPLHHWSSSAPDCLQSATELFRSPLLMSETVCLNTSPLHLP